MEFWTSAQGLDLLVRMVFGFVTAVAGIALWAHTREPSWILVIASTLLGYTEVLLKFLDALGVVTLDAWVWWGFPIVRVVFAGGVPLLLALGLGGALWSYRKP